ncbi:MAG TPA: hypothetical protein VHC39_02530 [Rhizomicrobium sp.]|nr:hypothetical protein [Rhizomicrobium sp.]
MAGHDVAQCGDSLFCRDDGMAEAKPVAADITRRAALPDERNGKDATLVWLKGAHHRRLAIA